MMKGDNKTFKFVSNNLTRNPNNQIRSSQRIWVEAGAGDKCVPPAKSKTPKRKGVAPPDPGGLSLDSIDWSSEIYSPLQIVKEFGKRLPLIVRVVDNFHSSELDLDFPSGQVIQLFNSGEQERLHAKLAGGRELSLPLNNEVILHTTEPLSSDHQKIEDLLEKCILPIQVEVDDVNQDAHGTLLDLVSKKMTLIKTVYDVFLRGNFINDGWIDQLPILMIPSHLDIEFEVALGMFGATAEEWKDYQGMFSRSVRHNSFKNVKGYTGVIDLNVNPRPISERHEHVKAAVQLKTKPPLQLKIDLNIPSEPIRDPIYANFDLNSTKSKTQNIEITAPITTEQNNFDKKAETSEYASCINFNGIDYQNYAYDDSENNNESGEALELTQMFDKVIEFGSIEFNKSSLSVKSNTYANNIKSQPNSSYICENDFIFYNTADSRTNLLTTSPDTSADSRTNLLTTSPDTSVKKKIDFEISEENKSEINFDTTTGWNVLNRITDLQEVPSNIHVLSIYQVSDCLTLLGMENHIKEFERHKVDGKKLSKLKENALQKDLSMNAFNANKLARFIRGWRPSPF